MNDETVSADGILRRMEMPGTSYVSTLALESEVTEGVVVVHTRGEVDVVTAAELQGALEETVTRHQCTVLIVDLSDVSFLASAGLAVLMRCSDNLSDRRCRFLVVAHSPATLRPLELTGLTEALEVYDSVEAALATV